jgi:hypothetical protein
MRPQQATCSASPGVLDAPPTRRGEQNAHYGRISGGFACITITALNGG